MVGKSNKAPRNVRKYKIFRRGWGRNIKRSLHHLITFSGQIFHLTEKELKVSVTTTVTSSDPLPLAAMHSFVHQWWTGYGFAPVMASLRVDNIFATIITLSPTKLNCIKLYISCTNKFAEEKRAFQLSLKNNFLLLICSKQRNYSIVVSYGDFTLKNNK